MIMDSIFIECFKELKDPRVNRTKKHLLLDIIAIAICAVICGAEGWEEIEDFGKARQEWFSSFLELPNGIPSHNTFSRVFGALKPLVFQEYCMKWFKFPRKNAAINYSWMRKFALGLPKNFSLGKYSPKATKSFDRS